MRSASYHPYYGEIDLMEESGFKVTKLPDDWRLSDEATKQRAFIDSLSPGERKRWYESQRKKKYTRRKRRKK